MYTFKSMLEAMNTGAPFTCELITFDESRKTGGLLRTIEARVIPTEKNGRSLTPQEQKQRRSRKRHLRNVQLLVDGFPVDQIRAIHIPLILKFNGQDVVP